MKSFRVLPLLALAALAPLTLSTPVQAKMFYRRGTGATPDTPDPTKSEIQPAARVIYDLFEGLYTLDAKGQGRRAVAESESVSADAKWSDGTAVTAADFVYSWRRLADPRIKGWTPNPLDFNLSQYLEVAP